MFATLLGYWNSHFCIPNSIHFKPDSTHFHLATVAPAVVHHGLVHFQLFASTPNTHPQEIIWDSENTKGLR